MAYVIVPVNINEDFSVSQPKITANFAEINTIISQDHETFDAPHGQGKHKQVTLPEQGTDLTAAPVTLPDEVALYCRQSAVGGDHSALFFRPEGQGAGVGVEYDFTTAGLASPGWCRLPCGLIMKWGISNAITINTSGTANLVNGAGIPNITTMLSCQLSMLGGNGTEGAMYITAFDDAGAHTITIWFWRAFLAAGTRQCYYLAIGI